MLDSFTAQGTRGAGTNGHRHHHHHHDTTRNAGAGNGKRPTPHAGSHTGSGGSGGRVGPAEQGVSYDQPGADAGRGAGELHAAHGHHHGDGAKQGTPVTSGSGLNGGVGGGVGATKQETPWIPRWPIDGGTDPSTYLPKPTVPAATPAAAPPAVTDADRERAQHAADEHADAAASQQQPQAAPDLQQVASNVGTTIGQVERTYADAAIHAVTEPVVQTVNTIANVGQTIASVPAAISTFFSSLVDGFLR